MCHMDRNGSFGGRRADREEEAGFESEFLVTSKLLELKLCVRSVDSSADKEGTGQPNPSGKLTSQPKQATAIKR